MDQKSLLIILFLILISSYLWNIIWDIGKASLYIVVILLVLTYISPDTADIIKDYGKRLLNLDTKVISELLSTISKFVFNIFKFNK
jgi:hypothetical protein